MNADDVMNQVTAVFPSCPLCLGKNYDRIAVKETEKVLFKTLVKLRCSGCNALWRLDNKFVVVTPTQLEKGKNPHGIDVQTEYTQDLKFWYTIRGQTRQRVFRQDAEVSLSAQDVLNNPSVLVSITNKYLIIHDRAVAGSTFDNLVIAINVMYEHGWRCINITSTQLSRGVGPSLPRFEGLFMYALMEQQEH